MGDMIPKEGKNTGNAGVGRPKGSPNKTTTMIKEAIIEAASRAGGIGGMVAYLSIQAMENPGPFMALLGKIIPTQVTGADDGPVQFQEVSAAEVLEARLNAITSRTPGPIVLN